MRVMVCRPGPAFSVADVHRGWVNGLREAGCDVVDLNFDDRLNVADRVAKNGMEWPEDLTEEERFEKVILLAQDYTYGDLYKFWPQLIVVVSGFYVHPLFYEVVRDRGHKVALLCTESPYEDDRQLQRAAFADVVVLNDPTNIEKFREVNKNTIYLPHAYDPAVHFPGVPLDHLESDFAFVGTGYPSRLEFLEQVDWDGIDAVLGGNWQGIPEGSVLEPFLLHEKDACIDNLDTVNVYRSTKMSANLYRKEATRPELSDGWAMGPREVELAATGTFFAREPRGEGDDLFPFLPTFTEPAELSELLRYYLARDDTRMSLAEKAYAAVADRTFVNNAKSLLARL